MTVHWQTDSTSQPVYSMHFKWKLPSYCCCWCCCWMFSLGWWCWKVFNISRGKLSPTNVWCSFVPFLLSRLLAPSTMYECIHTYYYCCNRNFLQMLKFISQWFDSCWMLNWMLFKWNLLNRNRPINMFCSVLPSISTWM